MTIEEIRTRVEAFLQAYNDHDVEAIVSHCTEDVVWEDPRTCPHR
jgi:ketosteroid isomerase-like protein